MSSFTARFAKIHEDAVIPTWGSDEAAGCDLYLLEDISVWMNTVNLARTGIVAIPPSGYHWEIAIRSSVPLTYPGLVLANSIGIIDSDYCGPQDEVKVALLSTNSEAPIHLYKGQRIAQLILRENLRPAIEEITHEYLLSRQSRGGFGSTGQ